MAKDPTERERRRLIAENRRARHDYEILDTLECGIALRGTEVKSLRQGKASIVESFALLRRGELWWINGHIPEYSHGNLHNHVPTRDRKLLVHRRESAAWESQVRQQGMTIVPLELYFQGALVKLTLGLAKGRKQYDKRERERERTDQRAIDRAMSRRRSEA